MIEKIRNYFDIGRQMAGSQEKTIDRDRRTNGYEKNIEANLSDCCLAVARFILTYIFAPLTEHQRRFHFDAVRRFYCLERLKEVNCDRSQRAKNDDLCIGSVFSAK